MWTYPFIFSLVNMDVNSKKKKNVFYQFVFRWACDDTVTHYIYQGRVGDNTREYRGVKEKGLHVVSQYWLQAVRFPTEQKLYFATQLVFTRLLVLVHCTERY